MSFYSFKFLFLFLPLALAAFFAAEKYLGRSASIICLVLLSLVFYGVANPLYVPLLAGSIIVNYLVGRGLKGGGGRSLMWAGILLNLAVLGYYKYMNFFLDIVGTLAGTSWQLERMLLPLGISFYTFQQITWLIDCHAKRADARKDGFWRYAMFVTFFPQLIAGPIVRHNETMRQFAQDSTYRFKWDSLAVGLSIFIIGLAKKILVADELANIVNPVYTDAAAGTVSFANAWLAAFCYAFQVYFDFSGYSDMAVGVARMFNIRLPMNFNSPFKSGCIVDLWKGWHMTMTRFFQSYVHAPLSMLFLRMQDKHGVKGNLFMYLSTFITLVVIGLWHGANWTFIIFGLTQGCAIVCNHMWRTYRKKIKLRPMPYWAGLFLTFTFFMLTCVIYRAENLDIAMNMYHSMFVPDKLIGPWIKINKVIFALCVACACFLYPNTQQIMRYYKPVIDMANIAFISARARKLVWRPTAAWAGILLLLYIFSLNTLLDSNKVQEFIYFKF